MAVFLKREFRHCIFVYTRQPLILLLIGLATCIALPFIQMPDTWLANFRLGLRPLMVALLGWIVIGVARGAGEWLEKHYHGKKARDPLGIRRFNTQIRILMRVIITALVILTLVGMAMTIPALRQLGMSLFASAGVAGIVIGIASKETLSNVIAGAQLALTQQILIGDEVVVNDQFGTIEEITSSFVVVRTWDLRRLVVPLRYFMENCFENWTYHETALFGPVYLYTDYTVDMASLRSQAEHIVKTSSLWDGKRFDLLVTESKENTLQIRVSMSARNSAEMWSLQCEVREKLITYLQQSQITSLPKTRVSVQSSPQLAQQ
jgi:small-conductance mechanosensitive channel